MMAKEKSAKNVKKLNKKCVEEVKKKEIGAALAWMVWWVFQLK